MNETSCEYVLMAKMAELDDEGAQISAQTLNSHFSICENCRTGFEQMQTVGNLLKRQTRREQKVNLWAVIEKRIGGQTAKDMNWKPFVLLGVLLVAYILLEMLPRQDFGLMFKLVPLVFIVGLFVLLKENPFKINTELVLER